MTLEENMIFKKNGNDVFPLFTIPINGKYILSIYQGNISKYDILIKYRQKINGKWSRIRTPKHIHWAVDILIKLHQDEKATQNFINRLLELWDNSQAIKDEKDFQNMNLQQIYDSLKNDIKKFKKLNKKGEYTVGFLMVLLKLLSIQEKTNRKDAYMFPKILEKLKSDNYEIFSLISTATHNGR